MFKIFSETVWMPLKANLPFLFLMLGTLLLIFASTAGPWLEKLPYVWTGTAQLLKEFSTAIIGAGVFAAVLKSAQFSEIFQKNIHDVFYRPDLAVDHAENVKKWKVLTQAMYRKCLPGMHEQATDKIVETFFDNELDYHFENMEVNFIVEMVGAKEVKIIISTKMNIVISPDKTPAIFQKVSDSNYKLLSLFLNNEKIDVDEATSSVADRPDLKQMTICSRSLL